MSAAVDPAIFKAYDIRGVYGEQIDASTATSIGRSFARVIGALEDKPTSELRLGLGRDMRLTAPELGTVAQQHQRIADAITRRDADAAAGAMEAHLRAASTMEVGHFTVGT